MICRIPRRKTEHTQKKKVSRNQLIRSLKKIGYKDLSDQSSSLLVRRCLPTGIPCLDVLSACDVDGVYGLPFGRQIEFSGKEDSGKTSIMLAIAASAQRQGYIVLWIETEQTLSKERAQVLGADIDYFLLDEPDYLEQAISRVKKAVEKLPQYDEKGYSKNKGLVIFWDSIAATPTKAEYAPKKKKDVDEEKDSAMADFARKMSRFQRQMKKKIAKRNVMMIYANQIKEKIGVMFGSKTATYGGKALKYHCTLRFVITYTGKIKGKNNKPVGMTIKVDNIKNKCRMPFRGFEGLEFTFGGGFNYPQALLYALETLGYAKKEGPKYFVYPLGQEASYKKSEFEKLIKNKPVIARKLMEVVNGS